MLSAAPVEKTEMRTVARAIPKTREVTVDVVHNVPVEKSEMRTPSGPCRDP
jgi:hypothetical protein